MGQTNSFTRLINSRKHIRLYAREYAEEHGLNASEVEKDIIQARKQRPSQSVVADTSRILVSKPSAKPRKNQLSNMH